MLETIKSFVRQMPVASVVWFVSATILFTLGAWWWAFPCVCAGLIDCTKE